jgi:hypothetical protein
MAKKPAPVYKSGMLAMPKGLASGEVEEHEFEG